MPSGLIVVDKPAGWTSHQVVGRVRRLMGTKKVGHAGTLDPMATGVLLVGVERATRLLGYLAGCTKTYEARIRLGQETVTDDAEGEVTSAAGAGAVSDEQVVSVVGHYLGDIVQVPSTVSAIKVNGQRAYARVRRGEEVALVGRPVTVTRFDVLAISRSESDGLPVVDVDVEVDCSTGTYIRALARDVGRELGTGGHLTRLRRTRVGGFALADTQAGPEQLAQAGPLELFPMAEVARRAFAVVDLTDDQARDVGFGRSLALTVPANPTAMLHAGEFLALYRPGEPGRAVPVAVLAGSAGHGVGC